MRKCSFIVFMIVLILFGSCSQSMLISYQVLSEEGTFKVLYSGNITEIGDTSWSAKIISDGNIFLYVTPLEEKQTIDVRVFYESSNGSGTVKRVISDKPVYIEDKLRVY